MSAITYKQAGVDIDAGQALVDAIQPLARETGRPGVVSGLGGFGALFDLKAAGYRDPILVASTDGVGTKLKIAITSDRHEAIGIDLVAMVVNDIVVQGAEPLLFLDYYATSSLAVAAGRTIIAGIAEGCRMAGCALIGGETAEMPGLYADGDYDLAGFGIGAVERDQVLTGADVKAGDLLLGLASSGLHANGFSLVRRIVAEALLNYAEPAPFAPEISLAEALLAPTRIYVRSLLAALRLGGIHALAHITGGGLIDNIPRVLPPGLGCILDATAWPRPPVFGWLAQEGRLPPLELARTFNCGIGMVVVAHPDRANTIGQTLADAGETVYTIGRIVPVAPDHDRVSLTGTDTAWAS